MYSLLAGELSPRRPKPSRHTVTTSSLHAAATIYGRKPYALSNGSRSPRGGRVGSPGKSCPRGRTCGRVSPMLEPVAEAIPEAEAGSSSFRSRTLLAESLYLPPSPVRQRRRAKNGGGSSPLPDAQPVPLTNVQSSTLFHVESRSDCSPRHAPIETASDTSEDESCDEGCGSNDGFVLVHAASSSLRPKSPNLAAAIGRALWKVAEASWADSEEDEEEDVKDVKDKQGKRDKQEKDSEKVAQKAAPIKEQQQQHKQHRQQANCGSKLRRIEAPLTRGRAPDSFQDLTDLDDGHGEHREEEELAEVIKQQHVVEEQCSTVRNKLASVPGGMGPYAMPFCLLQPRSMPGSSAGSLDSVSADLAGLGGSGGYVCCSSKQLLWFSIVHQLALALIGGVGWLLLGTRPWLGLTAYFVVGLGLWATHWAGHRRHLWRRWFEYHTIGHHVRGYPPARFLCDRYISVPEQRKVTTDARRARGTSEESSATAAQPSTGLRLGLSLNTLVYLPWPGLAAALHALAFRSALAPADLFVVVLVGLSVCMEQELIHRAVHTRGSRLECYRWFQVMRALHFLHHKDGMQHNYAMSDFLLDIVSGNLINTV